MEKKLTREELDQAGLSSINIESDNKKKIADLFEHFISQNEPLPGYGVNEQGDMQPNLSKLARLAKVVQGAQVFKRAYANDALVAAIKKCGIEDPQKIDGDEVTEVRAHLQESVEAAQRKASTASDKLQDALNLNVQLQEDLDVYRKLVNRLKAQMTALKKEKNIADNRVFDITAHERRIGRRAR
jgi:hypothetical protein